jgi:hypothetical protein
LYFRRVIHMTMIRSYFAGKSIDNDRWCVNQNGLGYKSRRVKIACFNKMPYDI